jgi:hypothetical protein
MTTLDQNPEVIGKLITARVNGSTGRVLDHVTSPEGGADHQVNTCDIIYSIQLSLRCAGVTSLI